MISRNGVFYDFALSPYRVTMNDITFVFSSKLHLDNFINRLEENRESISLSLSNRFKTNVELNTLADLALYRKIETRGYMVLINNEVVKCPNNIILGGEMANKTN